VQSCVHTECIWLIKIFERTVKQEEYSHVQNFTCLYLKIAWKRLIISIVLMLCAPSKPSAMLQTLIFSSNPTVSYCDVLYTKKAAYSEIIWDLLKLVPSSKQHVMIIGHNPGLTDFLQQLACS